ncbi:MAG TPA: ATP-dependent RecD-like DNA helicase [Thermoanaerobaculia bacterium]|nr:ATP-dependent RecD-like DNA helicase [Thermoanaerobaculia bacterium]
MSLPFESPDRHAQTSTLEGVLERVVFANEENAWSVVRLAIPGRQDLVTAVGNLLGVQPGENLRLTGTWGNDPKHGRQFRVTSYTTITPATVVGIEKYLGSGLIRGIGKVMAKRLVGAFGLGTLDVIENDPDRLTEVEGIGPKRSSEIRRSWVEQRDIKDVMVFLQSHGVSTQYAIRIYKAYGPHAAELVRQNPYRLASEVYGFGFLTADKIASALGLPADAPQRLEAGALYVLSRAADRGHLYLPWETLVQEAAELLKAEAPPIEEALGRLAQSEQVVVEPLADPEEKAVYLKHLHAAEAGVAERIRGLLLQPQLPLEIDLDRALDWFEQSERLALAREQRQAIRAGLTRKVLVITGGPGTGKTTLVRGLVKILVKKGQRVLLGAPTGRAAKRLSEATGAEAMTLHRLLEWNPHTRGFERNRDRPLFGDLLIVDEVSMLDMSLAAHLLRAVPDHGRLVLVGDVDQLPSVGPGKVLADLIRSEAVEVVRLTEIFRQAERSLIVVNAHRVNHGMMPVLESVDSDGDFFFIERRAPEEVVETISELVARRIPARFGFDPVEQIQVLTPMNRGPLGTDNLNAVLRELLNPEGAMVIRGGQSLRVGDKVMQVRNNYELEVFNGDIGRVTDINEVEQLVRVVVDGREVGYDFGSLDELRLAYACSIHKSQGSEYPCVVLPLHTQHYIMLQRNLLYTGLTRAKRLAILVGENRALAMAIGNKRVRPRFSRLAERLR